METRNGATPVIPLPNPGEGGPVYPGDEPFDPGAVPVIPLPNPGEGGPVYPGPDASAPQRPVRPNSPVIPGRPIVIQPLPSVRPIVPARYAAVRFLNATHGYPPFVVFIDGVRVINLLDAGSASGYVRIPYGVHTITLRGQDGYVYIEQRFPFSSGSLSTLAVINRTGGLELMRIRESAARPF